LPFGGRCTFLRGFGSRRTAFNLGFVRVFKLLDLQAGFLGIFPRIADLLLCPRGKILELLELRGLLGRLLLFRGALLRVRLGLLISRGLLFRCLLLAHVASVGWTNKTPLLSPEWAMSRGLEHQGRTGTYAGLAYLIGLT
jgi:hypothetical protein